MSNIQEQEEENLMVPPIGGYVQYVYNSYTEAQSRAIKKYRQNNKETINESARKYYEKKMSSSEDYKLKRREYAKKYYLQRKEMMQQLFI